MTKEEEEKRHLVESIKLKPGVTFESALERLRQVRHQAFLGSLGTHWNKSPDGNATPESKCWFFCWGFSGNNSDNTLEYCKKLWNKFFDKDHKWFDDKIGYKYAQGHRLPKRAVPQF